MNINEKIALFAETLDVEADSVSAETVLADLPEYDSMAKLSLIVMFDEQFGKKVDGETVKGFQTVGDILDLMD
ncbi:MAG: acyl carrier protein [Oscillospiraceae bacterium]|nr:acyl carrier protein [Oscillospiraceae bacterium]MBR3448773.1 acyl carrier protein [Oscillospiraceae bacterium]